MGFRPIYYKNFVKKTKFCRLVIQIYKKLQANFNMKIAINIEQFLKDKGGAERYAVGLANTLAEKGHDVHILACSWDESCEKYFHCHRIPHSWFRT